MREWFTVERIDGDTFAISEYGHWEETHAYLLLGAERAALIDTGMGVADIRAVVDGLTRLPVSVLTTHVHWDHIGGHGRFDNLAVHALERSWLAERFPIPLEAVRRSLTCRPCDFPEGFSVENYRIFQGEPTRLLRDGMRIDLGGRTITAIHTPGHSPGHCCFYEENRGYLYAGDLIYAGCLDAFYPTTDPVAFAQSVRRVAEMDVRRLLPGHHGLNVSTELIGRIRRAFDELEARGELKQGAGVFPYDGFQIHL